MIARDPDIQQLLGAITAAGGTVPKPLTDVVTSMAAVRAWAPPEPTDIRAKAERGELTAASAEKVLAAALTEAERLPDDLRFAALEGLRRRFGAQVVECADALLTSLQPIHAAAATKLAKAAEVVPAGMSTAAALEVDGGTAAWRELATQRKVLDNIHVVVQMLVGTFSALGEVDPALPRYYRQAAMYMDNAGRYDSVFAVLNAQPTHRGGIWHVSPGACTLRTLTEARELYEDAQEAAAEAAAEHYARTHGVVKAV